MSTMKWVSLVNRQALFMHKLLCLCDKLSFECTSESTEPCGKIINWAVVGPTGGQTTCLWRCWNRWRVWKLTSYHERLSQAHVLGSFLWSEEQIRMGLWTTLCLLGTVSLSPPLPPASAFIGMFGHGHILTYNEKWKYLHSIFRGLLEHSTLRPLFLPLSFCFLLVHFLSFFILYFFILSPSLLSFSQMPSFFGRILICSPE